MREGDQKPSSAAVDLSQFRNEEVGKGYQAKGVVRQRGGATNNASRVVDMSGGSFSKQNDSLSKKKKRIHEENEEEAGSRKKQPDPLQSYLQCQGMRDFVKEVDKILQQR